jgi:hypothetical protein
MDEAKIEQILAGQGKTTEGTSGEQGYGFGLALVKHLMIVDVASKVKCICTE